jgi:hypothetical protein
MASPSTVKLQNNDRIFRVERPPTFDHLKTLFEARFNLAKSSLSIYYVDPSDGNKTHVDDDSDYQLAFDSAANIKFFCDDQPATAGRGNEPLTLDVLKNSYFKNWHKPTSPAAQFGHKVYKCYSCKLSRQPSAKCVECGGSAAVDFNTAFPKLTQLIHRSVEDLVLSQFRALHDKITSKNGKLDLSATLNDSVLGKSSMDVSRTFIRMHGTAAGTPPKDNSFFQRLSTAKMVNASEYEAPKQFSVFHVKEDDHELINTMISCCAPSHPTTSLDVNNLHSTLPLPVLSDLSCPVNKRQDSLAALLTNEKDGSDASKPKQVELVYDSVKICKVILKEGYITINIMIYGGENVTPWPEGVYIVGCKSCEVSKHVMTKLSRALAPRAFLAQVIKFELSEDLIKTNSQYEMLFTFQKEDKEKNISYWSKPFCVPFNTVPDQKTKNRLSCDFLSF